VKTAKKTAAKKARKVAPCRKCKGFNVPGRRVQAVARDKRGRFTK